MDNNENKTYNELKDYLESHSKEQLIRDFKEIEEFNRFGEEMLKILENYESKDKKNK